MMQLLRPGGTLKYPSIVGVFKKKSLDELVLHSVESFEPGVLDEVDKVASCLKAAGMKLLVTEEVLEKVGVRGD